MNNLNSVLLEGNVVRDPDTQMFGERQLTKFSIAVNRYYRNAAQESVQETSYVGIETWGSLAQVCSEFLGKGKTVRVVGRLKQERWKDNETNRERIVIVAEHVECKPATKSKSSVVEEEEEMEMPPEDSEIQF